MRINELSVDGAAVLDLAGKLRGFSPSETVIAAVRRQADQGRRLIVADLRGVPSVDADGVATLIHCGRLVRASGGQLCLVGLMRRIDDLVVITALVTEFEVFDTVAEAIGQRSMLESGGATIGRAAPAAA